VKRAIVRPPGASFAQAISSQNAAIDVALAQAQHREYRQALSAAGVAVELLPPDERYPDSCFMQDPALVFGGRAVILRPGAPSRRGEEVTVAEALQGRFSLAQIVEPGTIEGGDVLLLPDRILVGRSARTNRAGIAQLAVAVADASLPVYEIPTGAYLHLLTAATYTGRGVLLAAEDFAGHPAFVGLDVIPVAPADLYAANALGADDAVIVPAGYPRVEAALRGRGFTVLATPTTEFAKADGGVTCLALAWDE
jgi:dimethylargininase